MLFGALGQGVAVKGEEGEGEVEGEVEEEEGEEGSGRIFLEG